MTRWRGWSLVSFILVLALAATALPDGPARAKQASKAHWVNSAPLPPGIVSAAHKTPQLPPTQPPAPSSGPMHDAVQKIKEAQNHVPVNAAGTPPRADIAAQNAKLAAARAKGWLVGNGPANGRIKAPRFKVGPDNIGDSKAAPAGAVYGATYAPASGFDVNPRYDTPGEMWVTVTNTGNFTWAANTVSMGYHLYRSDGSSYNLNGLSSAITVDVPAGSSVTVYCSFEYLPAGSFKLVWRYRPRRSRSR
ncbi:hypothetical protein ABH926_007230 [Catenulispora sp. GP43]|uniref:hypothetical protein n=1 Tax=Catenulispora sp. GP43 TaxID=3156263 RepID=UPI0035111C9A